MFEGVDTSRVYIQLGRLARLYIHRNSRVFVATNCTPSITPTPTPLARTRYRHRIPIPRPLRLFSVPTTATDVSRTPRGFFILPASPMPSACCSCVGRQTDLEARATHTYTWKIQRVESVHSLEREEGKETGKEEEEPRGEAKGAEGGESVW